MQITLPYPPSANRLWRVARGVTYSSAEALLFKREVANIAYRMALVPLEGPCKVTINAYRARKVGDLDNVTKVTLDSLIGWAYSDDKQIVEIHLFRHDDKFAPRLEVTVQEADNE